jgi:hypothetical protein
MSNERLDLGRLHVEDVAVEMSWWDFKPGTSFFLPCLNCKKLHNEIEAKAKRAGVSIIKKTVFENKVKGIRVWRVS